MSRADPDRGSLARTLTDLAARAVADLNLVVDDLTITPAGKRRVVRVSVDDDLFRVAAGDERSVVPGIGLDRVADATKAVSAALDDSDAMGQAPYVLEVSSPGVGKPLTHDRQFRRNVGRLIEVTPADRATVTGRIAAARPGEVTLALPATKTEPEHERTFRTDDLGRARVQVEFSRTDPEGTFDSDGSDGTLDNLDTVADDDQQED